MRKCSQFKRHFQYLDKRCHKILDILKTLIKSNEQQKLEYSFIKVLPNKQSKNWKEKKRTKGRTL